MRRRGEVLWNGGKGLWDWEGRQNQQAVLKVQLVLGSQGLLQGSLSHCFSPSHTHTYYTHTHTHTHNNSLHHCSLSGSNLSVSSLLTSSPPTFVFFTFAVSVIFTPSPFLIHWLTMMNFPQLYGSWQKKFAQQSFESKAKRVWLMILVQVQHDTL